MRCMGFVSRLLRLGMTGEGLTREDTGASSDLRDLRFAIFAALDKGIKPLEILSVATLAISVWQSATEAPATDPPASPNSGRTEQPCEHVRLNEDGICRTCGADRRGI